MCKGVAGNGWGEEGAVDEAGEKKALGDERAWLRGWLRMAWVQGSGWKWGEEAAGDDRTAANGLGAREWLEMGGEKSRWG